MPDEIGLSLSFLEELSLINEPFFAWFILLTYVFVVKQKTLIGNSFQIAYLRTEYFQWYCIFVCSTRDIIVERNLRYLLGSPILHKLLFCNFWHVAHTHLRNQVLRGLNFQDSRIPSWTNRLSTIFWSHAALKFLNSLSAPKKFALLSLINVADLPVWDVNHIIAFRQLSPSNIAITFLCTSCTVTHVKKQHQRFSVLRKFLLQKC